MYMTNKNVQFHSINVLLLFRLTNVVRFKFCVSLNHLALVFCLDFEWLLFGGTFE